MLKIKTSLALTIATICTLTAFVQPAMAAPGFVSRAINMRAGPGVHYPVVAKIAPRAPLNINGCTQGWKWCDVDAGNIRGWISGRYLMADYNNRRMVVLQSGSTLALPVVVFNQNEYWGAHYRDRPFYRDDHPGRGPDHGHDRGPHDHRH